MTRKNNKLKCKNRISKFLINVYKQQRQLMFKYTINYLTSFGSMTIHENKFNCRAWTKWGAWKKFLEKTQDEAFYESKTGLNNFWRKRKDIKFCGGIKGDLITNEQPIYKRFTKRYNKYIATSSRIAGWHR